MRQERKGRSKSGRPQRIRRFAVPREPSRKTVVNPKFIAEIQLAASQDGGRLVPLVAGEWRTVLGVNGESWSARLLFTGNPEPGETFRAEVQMLVPEAYEHFPVGAEFTVWENGTKGKGHVLTPAV